jgi:arsenite methyltransferase
VSNDSAKPDYGIDAPGVIRNLIVSGIAVLLLGWFVPSLTIGPVTLLLGRMSIWPGISLILGGLLMIVYAKVGKFRHRDRMLKMVDWKGNETVLDVGTGRGLLMIAAAKKLESGKSVGIDIWSKKDLSGNSMDKTLRNAEIEDVRDRVDVQNGDATAMKFADGSFDVVLSNLCMLRFSKITALVPFSTATGHRAQNPSQGSMSVWRKPSIGGGPDRFSKMRPKA